MQKGATISCMFPRWWRTDTSAVYQAMSVAKLAYVS